MIQKLYEMAKYIPEELINEYTNDYGLCIDERKEKVLVLSFILDGDHCEYKGIHVEDYSKSKNLSRLFYKKAPGNSKSEFPTIFVSNQISVDSTETNRFKNILEVCAQKEERLSPLLELFKKDEEYFVSEIKNAIESKDLYILTLKVNGDYIGESPLFQSTREAARIGLFDSFFMLGNKKIIGKNKTCSLCLASNKDVWGYAETFKFYAAKTSLTPIAGGFKSENAWKNYPICSDCAIKLEHAKSVLEQKMNYKLYGINYFIIPSFIHENKEENQEIVDLFIEEEHLGKYSIRAEDRKKITDDEHEILDMLANAKNMLCYNLFFYERNNSEFKILASIDEVFPSQLTNVFKAKKRVENYDIFKNLPNLKDKKDKGSLMDQEFSLGILKEFFPRNMLLEITRSIFLQKKVSYSFVLRQIMSMIERKFANDEVIYFTTLKSYMLLRFMADLGIIKDGDNNNKSEKEIVMDELYQKFFDEHSGFFDSNIKKAIFLQGVLCQHLLDIQQKDRGATPFRSMLNSMKLNERLIKKLLPEIIEKLEQYDKNYYRKLETTISELFINAEFDLSNDEISYYFVLGMNLNKKFKTKKEEEDVSE